MRPGGASIASRGYSPTRGISIASRGMVWAARPRGDLTPFNARLELDQGRMIPTASTATAGRFAFVLGCDTEGMAAEIVPGDYTGIEQDIDLTDVDLVRADLVLRTPADVPAGQAWRAAILIDSVIYASARGWPGRTRNLADLAANVSKLAGVHEVAFRLDLVEV